MKRTLLIAGAIVLLIVLIGLVFALIQHNQPAPSNTTASSTNPFPISGNSSQNTTGSNGTTSGSSGNTGLYSVENTMGGTILTKNFMNNSSTVVDPNNKDDSYLAGAPAYCTNTSCPPAPTEDYYILYRQSSKAFIIGLLNEPLGQSRLEAQQFLMNALGITQTQMCDLNYYVLTTGDVNPVYTGKNLGFSFCPGATALP
jgi:hypothetical protein